MLRERRRAGRVIKAVLRREDRAAAQGRRAAAGRVQDGQGLRRHQAQALGRRQDGRPPRQQGRDLADPARGGHALPGGRHARRHRAEPARRALAHERRPDPRDAPRLGGARSGPQIQRASEHSYGRRSCATSSRRSTATGAPRELDELPTTTSWRSRAARAAASTWRPPCSTAPRRRRSASCCAGGLPHQRQDRAVRRPHGRAVRRATSRSACIYMMKLHHLADDKIHAR